MGGTDCWCAQQPGHTAYNQAPMQHPLRHGQDNVLANAQLAPQGGPEVLYYEVLRMPLPALERLREVKVGYLVFACS